jgi:hypothetical protein
VEWARPTCGRQHCDRVAVGALWNLHRDLRRRSRSSRT